MLVVEDETGLADILCAYLERDGLRALRAADGAGARKHLAATPPDIVLLDIRLPGEDGIELLRAIRQAGDTPVIMTTALADDMDKMHSLHLGADDYVVKPYNPAEVVARVRAVLRRTYRPGMPEAQAPLRVGRLEIDTTAWRAGILDERGESQPLTLTLTEFRLLACLARNPRQCFSRDRLFEDRVIDSHLSKLRRKLQDAGCGELIETVRGVGYRLWPDA
ncbi:response regulator transcription factor [Candidatus Dactylopiibacterium carminicum]|uniref:response regulator transcription factor n=1 Tax=Candidatus Dactylopiibacterium carminicum TaxID=857335 RepID=UPI001CC29A39|nr:response regulator transcription factor [Candidatus Dactylopiibacterium carminicum]